MGSHYTFYGGLPFLIKLSTRAFFPDFAIGSGFPFSLEAET